MPTPLREPKLPDFDFALPDGYRWLWDRGLVSVEPSGPLQPWHYIPASDAFEPTERWPQVDHPARLVAFAKRQDSDDLACFEVAGGRATRIVLVHGWTPEGYEVEEVYPDFWDWLKSVIDDIAEWVSLGDQ